MNKTFIHQFVEPPKLIQVTDEKTSKRHYGLEDGTIFPSVTTILSELPSKGLLAWKKRVGEKEAEKKSRHGSNRGTALHKVVEQYVRNNGIPQIEHPIVKNLFRQIQASLNAFDNVRLIETALYSKRLRMAGTPDYIGEYGNVLSVLDLKTSTKPKQDKYIWSYWCQVAAYAVMYEELYGIRPEQGVILIGVEESPVPQVFKKSIDECFGLLVDYVKRLEEYRKTLVEEVVLPS